ncbi:DarT ssDNA thymidine ADP-ribosyltransferase family protein [Devosia sp. FKR38]|uniref:DarT ssDNA thymidine ADP-ribosyltransferase family protein n=1 Tax=Devosia sp. FKR38 TaxID=2562312 RepID=UPI0010C1504D|nr:DarT ssDNA thymidine ADP-ribosyltransferase family protein [Devosia sp. FKR38]
MTLEEIIKYMEVNSVHFRHFTDGKNISSIVQHGLLSMSELRRRGLVTVPGGNDHSLEADAMFGMDQYVHLCFRNSHPMAYKAEIIDKRIQNVRWLKVSATVLAEPGVLICDGVSNKSGAQPLPPAEIINKLDWEILYGGRLKWKEPQNYERLKIAEKYEVLVPVQVAHKFIKNLNG